MACSASDQLLACVCPRFVTPSRSGSEIPDLHLSEVMSHSSLYCVKDHCCVTCRASAYSTELPVDCLSTACTGYCQSILTHNINYRHPSTYTWVACTFAFGSSISPASVPWYIIHYPQNYNTIISQNRKEHISFGLQNTVWAHPLSTAGINNNVIINPSLRQAHSIQSSPVSSHMSSS